MNKLLALADRVEKLTGPDREVDALIWCHTKGIDPRWVGTDCRLLDAGEEGIIGWIDPGKTQRNFSTNRQASGPGSIPAYTASLDAAWSLIPDGFKVREFEQDSSHEWQWWCWLTTDAAEGNGSSFHQPQLALLAAALRARAHGGA